MLAESNTCGTLPRYSARRNLHHVAFVCRAPEASHISIVGDFNDWNPDANPMMRQPDGQWLARLELKHGHHRYAFLVDGNRVLDPNATGKTRDSQGEPVSLRAVS